VWVVASLAWVTCFAVIYGTAYNALPSKVTPSDIKPAVGRFDDLIPKYKPCWDYRTDDGRNIDITKLSDEALVRVYECQIDVERQTLLKTAAATIATGPILMLALVWSLLWIGRGFCRDG